MRKEVKMCKDVIHPKDEQKLLYWWWEARPAHVCHIWTGLLKSCLHTSTHKGIAVIITWWWSKTLKSSKIHYKGLLLPEVNSWKKDWDDQMKLFFFAFISQTQYNVYNSFQIPDSNHTHAHTHTHIILHTIQ